MTNPAHMVPLRSSVHRDLRFKFGTLFFAVDQAVLPLALTELPKAVLHLPLAFQRVAAGLQLVAVCSLDGAANEFISPQRGLWLKGYVPNLIGVHPFGLITQERDHQAGESSQPPGGEQLAVGVITDSDWLSTSEGEPLFQPDGQPGPVLAGKMELLRTGLPNPARDARVLAPLEDLGLLAPWSQLPGDLLLVDQSRLAALTPAELARLRDAGSMPLVYAQLFSLGHVPSLMQIAQANAQWRASKTQDWELDLGNEMEMQLVFN